MLASDENVDPPAANEFSFVVTVIRVVILVVFLVPLAQYTVFQQNGEVEKNTTASTTDETDRIMNVTVGDESQIDGAVLVRMLPQQPACPISQLLLVLKEICTELVEKKEVCTPGDVHNRDKHMIPIPKHYARNSYSNSKKAPQLPDIVNWALGGLLVTSLCAALIELYRAKRHPEKKNGKNPLSRKCSLADLTVLKHHRKEMVRRDSLMEVPEESLYAKQLGSKPPPLHRRCSFPIGPGISSFTQSSIPKNNRRSSLARSGAVIESRMPSVMFDNRRQSVVIDSRRTSLAGSVSCVEEEAKRHHVRLVHRH